MEAISDPIVVTERPGPSAEGFFTILAPKLLKLRKRALMQVGGRFGFSIDGDGGGDWTIDLSKAQVEDGAMGTDVMLAMKNEDFLALLKGSLDIPEAMGARKIRVEGRVELLRVLASAFRPS